MKGGLFHNDPPVRYDWKTRNIVTFGYFLYRFPLFDAIFLHLGFHKSSFDAMLSQKLS